MRVCRALCGWKSVFEVEAPVRATRDAVPAVVPAAAAVRKSDGCPHGRQPSRCDDCGGCPNATRPRCEHGRDRYFCRVCVGAGACQHCHRRSDCKVCGSTCVHDLDLWWCRSCSRLLPSARARRGQARLSPRPTPTDLLGLPLAVLSRSSARPVRRLRRWTSLYSREETNTVQSLRRGLHLRARETRLRLPNLRRQWGLSARHGTPQLQAVRREGRVPAWNPRQRLPSVCGAGRLRPQPHPSLVYSVPWPGAQGSERTDKGSGPGRPFQRVGSPREGPMTDDYPCGDSWGRGHFHSCMPA